MEINYHNEFSGKHLSEMINKSEHGPQIACDHLYALYNKRVEYKTISILKDSCCNDPHTHGEDVIQQIWIAVKKDFDKFSEGGKPDYTNPRAWLDQICRNTCLKHIDEYKRAKILGIDDTPELELQNNRISSDGLIISSVFDNPERQLEDKQSQENAFRLLSQMDKEKQQIIRMRLYEDISYTEISKILGISELSARQKYSRALRELKKKYEAGGK
jgi:RNA polymerase sigma-70 factor (ECF subfamily)